MTPRGSKRGRTRCPVCGSRKLIPSLGGLGATHQTDALTFAWRCRSCHASMRAVVARDAMWRRRRPIANWLFTRSG